MPNSRPKLAIVVAMVASASLAGCERRIDISPLPDRAAALKIREGLVSAGSGGEDASGDEAEQTEATGWATLRGTFKFVGTRPPRGRLVVDKDITVCAKDGQELPDDSLLISPSGGIANVVIYARASRVHESAQPIGKESGDVQKVVFDQKGCMFLTHVLGVQVGQPIDVKNSDPVLHNTKIDPKQGASFNQSVPVGETILYKPGTEETLPAGVSCSIHPWMKAYILPRRDKYFAVTAEDGSFEIPNLPAGEALDFQVWHERSVGPQGSLYVNQPELKWTKKGRFKLKLEPEEVKELAIEVPADAFN